MTPQKETQEDLKDCEKKFFKALQEYPLPVTLTSAIDHRYIEVNTTFERISGWKRHEVIGRTPFDINIWVNPNDRIEIIRQLLSEGNLKNFRVHARLRNHEVWLGVGFAALIEINGEACILAVMEAAKDLKTTDQEKHPNLMLATMARRLIQEQEEERALVAQELHNCIDRAFLVSLNLERVCKDSELLPATNQQLADARRGIEDIVMEIQELSNRLYSSKLEYLGLRVAAAALCRDISDKHKVVIHFVSDELPKEIPSDVSLCLFRVLQGALQNVLSHTGSPILDVSLRGGPNEVQLTIRHSGSGLDVEDVTNTRIIDIPILKERVTLVGGEFSVESEGGRGTKIEARVPLRAELIPETHLQNS